MKGMCTHLYVIGSIGELHGDPIHKYVIAILLTRTMAYHETPPVMVGLVCSLFAISMPMIVMCVHKKGFTYINDEACPFT